MVKRFKEKNLFEEFLNSAFEKEGYMSTPELLSWLTQRRESTKIVIESIPFDKLRGWQFDESSGDLSHVTGSFFSIIGIDVSTNFGQISQWRQPIILQSEIGILGIIVKKINGVLHFLMQSKIEPGNINFVQLSPTLQATKSNYTRVHQGKSPKYLDYFIGTKPRNVILDQLQSEQGGRFLRKRNRNIIIEVEEELELHEDFCWLTLGQLKDLMHHSNLLNMDTRTVLSTITLGNHFLNTDIFPYILQCQNKYHQELLLSAVTSNAVHSIDHILSWITELKCKYFLDVRRIPLNEVSNWVRSDKEIFHVNRKYFSVLASNIEIQNREVSGWTQPLVKPAQEGLIAFIIKSQNGVMHFLVQAKIEPGNFDVLELAPTVQCLTGNYRRGYNDYNVPFVRDILNADEKNIIYKAMQSEEGGRFYQEQNLNMIIRVNDEWDCEIPENYCWMSLNQLYSFIKYNNYINIQARSLIASINFK